jgi:hypothetical protein
MYPQAKRSELLHFATVEPEGQACSFVPAEVARVWRITAHT